MRRRRERDRRGRCARRACGAAPTPARRSARRARASSAKRARPGFADGGDRAIDEERHRRDAGQEADDVPSRKSLQRICDAPATTLTTENGAIGSMRTNATAMSPRFASRRDRSLTRCPASLRTVSRPSLRPMRERECRARQRPGQRIDRARARARTPSPSRRSAPAAETRRGRRRRTRAARRAAPTAARAARRRRRSSDRTRATRAAALCATPAPLPPSASDADRDADEPRARSVARLVLRYAGRRRSYRDRAAARDRTRGGRERRRRARHPKRGSTLQRALVRRGASDAIARCRLPSRADRVGDVLGRAAEMLGKQPLAQSGDQRSNARVAARFDRQIAFGVDARASDRTGSTSRPSAARRRRSAPCCGC